MAKQAQAPESGRPGRRPSLNASHFEVLRTITHEQPHSSLDEVKRKLLRCTGAKVCTVTVRKALREAGIERLKPVRRLAERARGMNTDLTDAEWALAQDLFDRPGRRAGPTRPKTHGRRLLLRGPYGLPMAAVAQVWVWLTEARMLPTRLVA